MKKMFFAALLMAAMLVSCGDGGKTQLFNGKELSGWVIYTDPLSEVPAEEVFKVQDGVIRVSGQPWGYMRTAKKYADYTAYVEFRWADGEGSNSGFFQRVQEGDRLWPGMVECQVKVGSVGDLGGMGPFKPRIDDPAVEKPVGEWNALEVTCIGTHVTVKLNGVIVNEDETKFTEGFIALQSEGGPIEFRNVYVKEIKPASGADAPELIIGKSPLFNGENLRGWVLVADPESDVKAEDVFTVKDGMIHVLGNPFGYMRTRFMHRNYRLHVEWCWDGEGTNSGIFQRVQDGDKVWPVGMECQLASGQAGMIVGLGGYKVEGATQRGEFGIKQRLAEASSEKPVGEWNEADIECIGKHIKIYINGQLQNEADGEYDKGYIALQSEGGPLWFRNILLEEIR